MVENRIKGVVEDDALPKVITAQEVIKHRQYQVLNASLEMDDKIMTLEQELKQARWDRELLRAEYDMWDNYSDRNQIRVTHTSTTTVEMELKRKTVSDRMKFDDTLKGIMREAGKPLQFADIRARLERFGFVWNNYVTAHAYITSKGKGIMESAGKKGFYQEIRVK